ncbi:MAG TPA: nucleotidyltransferase domain-containing protein [Candidatus Nanoarchaeia archaeon]|nr:nucleotidyltransferase domain-containing protein [Candidatus Nanoarchaeia archaeon]
MIVNILNNKSIWKFIALASYSPGAGYTRKEIKKLLHGTNLSLDRTLSKLLFYKIITKDRRLIKLNFENNETLALLDLIGKEKKRMNYPSFELFIVLVEFLRLIEGFSVDSAYMFGSHAKKTASVSSDIDIAVFSQGKVNMISAKDQILQLYGKDIQLHYFRTNERSKLVSEVMKHGVRLI